MKSLMIWTRSVQPGQAPLENQLIGPDGLPIVKPPVLVLCLVIDAPEQLPPNSLWFTISICCVVYSLVTPKSLRTTMNWTLVMSTQPSLLGMSWAAHGCFETPLIRSALMHVHCRTDTGLVGPSLRSPQPAGNAHQRQDSAEPEAASADATPKVEGNAFPLVSVWLDCDRVLQSWVSLCC